MEIISNKLLSQAGKMAANAKNGKFKINNISYSFTFDHKEWHYIIKDDKDNEITKFNTKSLKQARQWLKEYFLN
jgi:hypothetical protein